MWLRFALLAVLCTACSFQVPQPQANASAARTGGPAQPSLARTPASTLLACRLPVVSWYQPGNPVQLPSMGVQADYVSYPDGAISPDPVDEFTLGDDGLGWRSSATPVLRGTGPVGYYDAAVKRFLPVPRAQVSPDGRRYAYMDYTQGGLYAYGLIHVVDAATGLDRTLGLPAAQYLMFDFSADGIYFTYGPYGQDAGLLLLNPDTGATHQVFPDGYVLAVANGDAWLAVNEQDPHPTSPLPGGEGNAKLPVLNVLLRRDIKSGQDTEWLRRPLSASGFQLLGVYSGSPAVLVYLADDNDVRWGTNSVPYEVWLVSRPATPEKVSPGITSDLQTDPWYRTGRVETSYSGLAISDAHGIWLGGSAIYLYQQGKGLTKIATFPGFPANGCM
jgi:hypothetical protein